MQRRIVQAPVFRSLAPLLCLLIPVSQPAANTLKPSFVAVTPNLETPHIYEGGWTHFVGGGVAVLDCNADRLPDLFLAGGSAPATLLVNRSSDEGIRFEQKDLQTIKAVTGAYPLDIDGDHHADLAVLRVGENLLLRGDGNCGFERANETWRFDGGDRWTTAFTAMFENADAWPTLVFGNYVDRTNPDGPFGACDINELHRPNANGHYGAPTELSPGYCALSALASDWKRTGRADLRFSNDRHYYVRDGFEEMWSLDPLRRLDASDGWEKVSLWGMGIASRDITGNGFPDVMLTSMGDQLLQFNDQGRLKNAPYSQGTYATRPHIGDDGRPSTGWHAQFGDVDNDGLADLFIAKGNVDQMPGLAIEDPNNLLMQQPDGTFVEASIEAGVASTKRSRGAALADLDMDGRLDLVVVNRRAPMEIWRNVTAHTGHWLKVALQMSGHNTAAVGAWVEVRTESGKQSQEVTIGGGHAGGQLLPLHFGLGGGKMAEIRVIWPDGRQTGWQSSKANRVVHIHY